MSDEKLKDKIRKLLNMTVENGCTEDEQESAMRMAAGLAARSGIELESIRQKDPSAAARKAIKKTVSQAFKIHQVLAAQAAAKLYGCDLFLYDGGKQGLLFVGREENVEMAEQTMFWLMRQVELLYKEALPKGMTQRARAEFRKTFKAACAHRVNERARDLMYEMRSNEQAAQQATGQNALVVQDYFKTLAEENAAVWEPSEEQKARAAKYAADRERREKERRALMTQEERDREDKELEREQKKAMRAAMRRKGPRARKLPTGNGTNAGFSAGDRVQLRKGVK